MTKRMLLLTAIGMALVVPAVSLADGGGSTPAPATAAKGGGPGLLYRLLDRQLDRRFKVFSKRCLVANAPDRCAKAANVFVKRLDRVQKRLTKMESTVKTKCAAANPPARCSKASQVTQAIDELLAKAASDETAIKAAFPSAGSC